jgi:G:T-mismatch repair DNA endonuclease (very short patch repair protein)
MLETSGNGDYYHANPAQYAASYVNKKMHKTAQEIWKRDAQKLNCAARNGFAVLVVWESDYTHDATQVIATCLNFLNT